MVRRPPPAPPSSAPAASSAGLLDPRSADPAERALLTAWLEVQRCAGLHPERVRPLLERGMAPEGVARRLVAEGRAARSSGRTGCERQLEATARAGAVAVPWGSRHYPRGLVPLADAPPLLWVRGEAAALGERAVAIVGARAATGYGRRVAYTLARDLARTGLVVISGLARGIDAAAHQGALETGRTVAVLGCGPDVIYPRSHGRLAERIAVSGLVVSEFAPGAPPLPHHFPLRNRVISGLAQAVVVVEAKPRSGSLITARHALEQGREVLAVPGPVDVVTSEGPNLLLRQGAAPALDASDVLGALGISSAPPAAAVAGPKGEELRLLWCALRQAPGSPDELAQRLGLGVAELTRRLVELELEGFAAAEGDGRFYSRVPS